MKNHTLTNNQEIRDTLIAFLGEDGIRFGQAISVCSCVVEMGLIKASIEDVADGLFERFQGLLEKKQIIETAIDAIEYGIQNNLIEPYTDGTFSLTTQGMEYGSDWSKKLKAETF